jgi:hypothetical protein
VRPTDNFVDKPWKKKLSCSIRSAITDTPDVVNGKSHKIALASAVVTDYFCPRR